MSLTETNDTARSLRLRRLTAASLIAALTAVLGPLAIPIDPVPITFQTFCVALAAMLLPPAWAAGSMALYVVLGAVGLPVFAKGLSGVGVVAGPTGGYLIGFIVAAGLASLVRQAFSKAGASSIVADIGAGVVLLTAVYGIGTAWLAYSIHASLAKAALLGVAPFLVGDIVKVGVAILVAEAVRKAGVRL
jgi:biotin transport system substrate-specific component